MSSGDAVPGLEMVCTRSALSVPDEVLGGMGCPIWERIIKKSFRQGKESSKENKNEMHKNK